MNLPLTLIDAIKRISHVEDRGINFILGDKDEQFVSYRKLYTLAQAKLAYLHNKGMKRGDELILYFDENDMILFLSYYWGCLLGGIIPVPVGVGSNNEHRKKLINIWNNLNNSYVITTKQVSNRFHNHMKSNVNEEFFATISNRIILAEDDTELNQLPLAQDILAQEIAFIQYSSGSTGLPKGVILTHENLISNALAINERFETTEKDTFLSWMPLTHDMGLIAFHLTPLIMGVSHSLMSTSLFIRRPLLWMKKVSDHHASITASPNFGYKYFYSKFKEELATDWNLSHVRIIVNGAEPISTKICEVFLDYLAPYGLKRNVFYLAYGLAEASVGVSVGRSDLKPVYVDRNHLYVGNPIKEAYNNEDGISVIDEGRTLNDCFIRICDDADNVVDDNVYGHIQIMGKNVTRGYYNNEKSTLKIKTEDNWVRTGDLGFVRDGKIHAIGRAKDIIFINGQNIYPHDIEKVAEGVEGIELGKVAACGVFNKETDENNIIIFVVYKNNLEQFPAFSSKIKGYINEQTGWKVTDVVPIRQMPKTTSGKIQRYKLAEEYEKGLYTVVSEQQSKQENKVDTTTIDTEQQLLGIFRQVLGNSKIMVDDRFFESGASSLQLTEIATRVEDELDVSLQLTDFFACPTITRLAQHIEDNILFSTQENEENPQRLDTLGVKETNKSLQQECRLNRDIAIIGVSGKFPLANDTEQFWRVISTGKDCIGPLGDIRKQDADEFLEHLGKDFPLIEGGFLDDIDKFDYSFFKMTPKEASLMDPNQRLFLQTVWHTIENAGYGGGQLSDHQVGVYVGSSKTGFDYERLLSELDIDSLGQYAVGNLSSIISGRISYLLNLKGPAVTIDTACSSSLVAVHMACSSILSGECEMALAGGVRTMLLPFQAGIGMESSDNRAHTFDDRSDGTGSGEGVAAVLLKPLDQAIADGDYIHAVIKGSAINQDGATVGMTAPNSDSQSKLIVQAWENAGIDPRTISYIEAHGTGTSLGDPIEIDGIKRAFLKYTDNNQFCGIGSVKANIGHLYEAAGIAGLVKGILCLQHKKIPPMVHFHEPNKNINFLDSPVYVPDTLLDWEVTDVPRRCGVSSFGFSGTNCHIILEEFDENKQSEAGIHDEYQVVTLSAKTKVSLYEMVRQYADFISCNPGLSIRDLSYTANIGRNHFPFRLAMVVQDMEQIKDKLTAILNGMKSENDVFIQEETGSEEENRTYSGLASEVLKKSSLMKKLDKGDLIALCQWYVGGAKIEWEYLYHSGAKPYRIPLPVYPFLSVRCWAEKGKEMKILTGVKGENNMKSEIKVTREEFDIKEVMFVLKEIVQSTTGFSHDDMVESVHFLEMGLDSIMLNQVKSKILKRFSIDIPMNMFFESLISLEKLSNYIAEQVQIQQPSNLVELPERSLDNNKIEENSQTSISSIAAIMEQQLQLLQSQQQSMSQVLHQQLEVLGVLNVDREASATLDIPFDRQVKVKQKSLKIQGDTTRGQTLQNKNIQKPFIPFQPILLNSDAGFSDDQKSYLDGFIKEYSVKTKGSKDYTQRYRKVHANNRNVAGYRSYWKEIIYPIVTNRASGSKIWDVDGNEYIDLTMGFGVNLFGHNPSFIKDALIEQLDGLTEPLGPMSHLSGRAAELISELVGAERVAFYNSGTEAVMVAIRLARAASGRSKIALFSGSFHGTFDGVLAVADAESEDGHALSMAPGIPQSYIDDVIILNYNNPQSLEILRENKDELAAVLVETVQSRRPDLQPKAFLQQIRELTSQSGVALIFDEVITGFRIDLRGAQGLYEIEADISVYGKVAGGGMPIGIVAGKSRYLDSVDGGVWNFGDDSYPQNASKKTFLGGTFCTHPLTMAATIKTLEHLKAEGPELQRQLNTKTENLMHKLNKYFKEQEVPIQMIHCGSLFRFVSYTDIDLFYYLMVNKGIYIWEGRNCFLSTVHTDDDLNKIVQIVRECVSELRSCGFIKEGPSSIKQEEKDPIVFPLTNEQKQIWFADKARKEHSAAFNETVAINFQGDLHLEALHKALNAIIGRHESLRSIIDGNREQQVVLQTLEMNIITQDFSEYSEAEKEVLIKDWFHTNVSIPFDLNSTLPLFRVHLLKRATNSHLLVMTFHHIIADGWSIAVIIDELEKLYSAYCQNQEKVSLPIPGKFRDYHNWQLSLISGKDFAEAAAYWSKTFHNIVPNIDLPSKTGGMLKRTFSGERVNFKVEKSVTQQLKKLSINSGNSLFVTLLTIYKIFIHRLTGDTQITIGVPTSGQARMQSYSLIGNCTNVLPVYSEIRNTDTFNEYVKVVKQLMMELDHVQSFPLSLFNDHLNYGHVPQLNIMFNMDRPVHKLEFYGLVTRVMEIPIEQTKYDMFMNVTEIEGELCFNLDVNTQLVEPEIVYQWAEYFKKLLMTIKHQEDIAVKHISLLTEHDSILLNEGQPLLDWYGQPAAAGTIGELQILDQENNNNSNPKVMAIRAFDGGIIPLGSKSRRIKIQGRSVYPELLETYIRSFAGVVECTIVQNHFDECNDREIIAFVAGSQPIDTLLLRKQLLSNLQEHWVPKSVHNDSIPVQADGQADWSKLPRGDYNSSTQVYDKGGSETEECLREIWQDIFSLHHIQLDDSFFDLGGSSLQATIMLSRIHKEFNITIPISELFVSSTISDLARFMEGSSMNTYLSIPTRESYLLSNDGSILSENLYPLSNAQERAWFRAQFTGITLGDLYAYEFTGEIDIEVFQKSQHYLAIRHEIMQTTIAEYEGKTYQKVHECLDVPLQYTDLSSFTEKESNKKIAAVVNQERLRQFNLKKESFYRMNLFQITKQKCILLVNVHHIGHDGWSHQVFLKDLINIYHSLLSNYDPKQQPQPLQYVEYTLWQDERLSSGALNKQRDYWNEKLKKLIPIPNIPEDHGITSIEPNDLDTQKIIISKELTHAIRKINACNGRVTTYMTVLTALNIWLVGISEQTTITVGSTLSGRTHPDLEEVLGLCINPVALRTDLSGNPELQEALERVSISALEAYENQDYPFDLIMQDQHILHGKDVSLYSVVLIGQNAHTGNLHSEEIKFRFCPLEQFFDEELRMDTMNHEVTNNEKTQFNLLMNLFEDAENLVLETSYNKQKFRPETVREFLTQIEHVLEQLVLFPHKRLSQVQLPKDLTLDELFAN